MVTLIKLTCYRNEIDEPHSHTFVRNWIMLIDNWNMSFLDFVQLYVFVII